MNAMEFIFTLMGIASLAYLAVVMAYNGLTTFLWFWPLFAVANFVMTVLIRIFRKRRKAKMEFDMRPFIMIFTTYGIGLLTLVSLLCTIFINARTVNRPGLDYVIVMGSALRGNKMTVMMKKRLDRAIEYYGENPNTVFCLSGGRSDYDTSTEATVMYYYMIQNGIPAENLLLEFYSNSNQEKIGYSLRTIWEDYKDRTEWMNETVSAPPIHASEIITAPDKPLAIGIITSGYNMLGAELAARHYGIKQPCPMSTPSDPTLLVHLSVREAIILFKDRLVGNV
jgi:hypothetical protein